MSDSSSGFDKVAKWIVLAILAILALKVAFTVLGVAWVLGGFLLFRVLPLVLVVWLVVKVIEWFRKPRTPTDSF